MEITSMRILTLKEIESLEFGECVPAFRAQIKQVHPPKSGTNEYGPWTIQRLTLMDSTLVLTAKLFNLPEYTTAWQGVWIYVECTPSDKGKLRGIEVIKDDYRGKVSKQLKISETATITQAQSETTTKQEPTQQAAPPATIAPPPVQAPLPISPIPTAPEPPAQARQQEPTKQQATIEDVRRAIAQAKEKLGQSANGLILCYDAAIYVANEVTKRHQEMTIPLFPPDVIEKLAISLWISLERSGLVMGLPLGPLEAWTKKQP